MARPRKNPEFETIQCKLCKCNFQVKYVKRNIQKYCSRKCSTNDPEIINLNKEKIKHSFHEKYGGHPMKTIKTKTALKQSLLQKYGKEHYAQCDDFTNKVKKTCLERYGVEHFNNREKNKKTCLERYGVENVQQIITIQEKVEETKRTNHYTFLVNFLKSKQLDFLCKPEDYVGYHFSNVYRFQCQRCHREFEDAVYNLNHIGCDKCDPDRVKSLETKLYDYITEIVPRKCIVVKNDRTVLNGKELDLYIPDKKVAIEINGLYWHSEKIGGIGKNYHLNKTKACAFYGIDLIHVFENEIKYKYDIIKSILNNKLSGPNIQRVFGRKCILKEISIQEKNTFLNINHLQGEDKSTVKLGLFYNNDLVSVMTFRRTSRFDTSSEWELMRFANKLNTNVIGGASKLFSYFINTYSPKSIVSYSDRRFFSGNIYSTLGFKFIGHTVPSYNYITPDYKNTRNRMNFQKHRLHDILDIFDPNLTEWENMKNNSYDRIWDCGNSKWIFSHQG